MEFQNEKKVLENKLEYEGSVLLTYKITYPVFFGPRYQMALAVINKFYEQKALSYQAYLENELFAQAVEQYKESIKNDFPMNPYEAVVVYRQTYASACVLSLYFDQYEYTGGAHGNTVRYSQVWNLQRCGRICLEELFCCGVNYKNYIFQQVKAQIEKNPGIYFDNYETLLVNTFNPESFYCTPYGIVIYYQQYDIAPYASGIREFLIPYSNCVQNPAQTCFSV